MGYSVSRFDTVAPRVLEAGEQILVAAFAALPGTLGLRGAMAATPASDFGLPKQFVLAVTDRRLLVFSPSKAKADPEALMASLELDQLSGVEFPEAKGKTRTAAFHFPAGSLVAEVFCAAMRPTGPVKMIGERGLGEVVAAVRQWSGH